MIALLLLAACTKGGDSDACATPTVEVGTGAYDFEPLADGDPITIVHGPQGGWHLYGSVRVNGIGPIIDDHYTITVAETGALVCDQDYKVAVVQDGACGGTYAGMFGYLDVAGIAHDDQDTPPELLAGVEVVLRMDVTDPDGRHAVGEVHAIGQLDPKDAGGDTDTDTGAL